MTGADKKPIVLQALILALLAIGLCLALLTALRQSEQSQLSALLNNPLWIPAVLLQIITTLLFIAAWQTILRFGAAQHYSFFESSAHIGVTLLGKYLPGKIWGLLGRSYLLVQRGESRGTTVNLLIADQFLTFYSGIGIAGTLLLAYWDWRAALPGFVLLLPLTTWVLHSYSYLSRQLTTRLSKRLQQTLSVSDTSAPQTGLEDSKPMIPGDLTGQQLLRCLLVYCAHWISNAAVLIILFFPLLQEQLLSNSLLILAAIPAAMLTGFVALWAPGGIVVRESVIIALLVLNLPLETATAIAITYRLLCVCNDLATGVAAWWFFSRRMPGILSKLAQSR